jgi:RNA polymerase sigma-70 factor (ECF subfamily)
VILREVLRFRADEVAEQLETSVASVNSALQRARATLDRTGADTATQSRDPADPEQQKLLTRYVEAFESYDVESLVALLREDAIQSMPPYDLWIVGREEIGRWLLGPGSGCRGSRLVPTTASGSPAFGQYRPSEDGFDPFALAVVEPAGDRIGELTFFLNTASLFPLFGLPPRLTE